MPHTNYQLSGEEMERFRRQGYLGPYALCSPDEMRGMQPAIERVLETDAPDHGVRAHNRHLDCPLIHELATHPAVVKRMAALYGPDLLLWRTNFFVKEPGAKEIPWHLFVVRKALDTLFGDNKRKSSSLALRQDRNYWPLEPPIIISAWIAVDAATFFCRSQSVRYVVW